MEAAVKWIVENWGNIPEGFKTNIKKKWSDEDMGGNVVGLESSEEHDVVLLLDRQKPSVEKSYDFDEERIGVNKDGKIIWGFDSGCSCPSPWFDSYPSCYESTREWKEFELDTKNFDADWEKVCLEKLEEIKKAI